MNESNLYEETEECQELPQVYQNALNRTEISLMELCVPALLYHYNYGMDNKNLYSGSQIAVGEYAEDTNLEEDTDSTEENPSEGEDAAIPTVGAVALTGSAYTREQLSDFQFLLDHCYTVDSTTYVDENEMNADTLLSMDMTMQQDNSDYQILIYHTHSSSETFADSRPGVLEDTPIGLGDTLTELLEGYGYNVYHDRTVYDQIDGKTDRNYAYTAAGEGIDKILEEHPSIEVIIDLHRDGVNENTHLVTEINGKPTAKIMFFNGVSRTVKNGELAYLDNPNRQANLAFSLQLYLAGEAAYDDYLRNIYIKGYQYNLDRRPKATLIEVGGQTNTLEEVNNAMEPLADILNEVLSGENISESGD
jgi:stage II sporulation protein P